MSEKESGGGGLREFHPVTDKAEARNLLKEAVRNISSAMIWTTEQKLVLNSSIRAFDEAGKTLYAWVPTEVDPAAFIAELDKLGSRECFFSISLSRANVFFKARCQGFDSGGFKFQTPDRIFKVQRRKDMRMMIPFGQVIRVEMPDPLFPEQKLTKKIFDLSASGMALIVTDTEAAAFQPGVKLTGVMFSIRSRRIKVEAEVRHIKAQPAGSKDPGHKIGLQFTKIDSGDAQWISAYIFEESRKTLTKYL